jgi:hypothetical protein
MQVDAETRLVELCLQHERLMLSINHEAGGPVAAGPDEDDGSAAAKPAVAAVVRAATVWRPSRRARPVPPAANPVTRSQSPPHATLRGQ